MSAKPKKIEVNQDLQDKSQGYVIDVNYIYSYFEELLPVNLKFLAAMRGYKTPNINKAFTYLELGCGNAVTLCLVAAVNPAGKFYGVDLMPQHIDYSKSLAKNSQLQNVTFIESSFEDLNLDELPEFDFIVAHGVMTWVSHKVRKQMRNIIDKKLKKDGFFYVSYNALPGWITKTPFMELAQYFTSDDVDSIERMKDAMKIMQFLSREKAGYFAQNPGLDAELEYMKSENMHYLAHEYMLSAWRAFYFHEVADFYKEIGLSFAGSFPYRNNFYEYAVPKNFHSFLELQKSDEKREEYKDFIRNTRFRKDLYTKQQQVAEDFGTRISLFDDLYFTSLVESAKLNEEIKVANMTYKMKGVGYDVLREMLPGNSYTLKDIMGFSQFETYKGEDVLRILRDFVVLSQAIPLSRPLAKVEKSEISQLKIVTPINQYLLSHFLPGKTNIMVACPETGTVITSNTGSAIVLHSYIQARGDEQKTVELALEQEKNILDKQVFRDEKYIRQILMHLKNNFIDWLVKFGVLK